jgi:hypothetical protein
MLSIKLNMERIYAQAKDMGRSEKCLTPRKKLLPGIDMNENDVTCRNKNDSDVTVG